MVKRPSDLDISAMRRVAAEFGASTRSIGRLFGVSSGTVSYWLRKKSLRAPPRQPPTRSEQEIRRRQKLIKSLAERRTSSGHRAFPSSASIVSELRRRGVIVSKQTVLRDLRALGFRSLVRPKVCIYAHDPASRLSFCRAMRSVASRSIAFSDEKIFTTNNDGSRLEWVLNGDLPHPRQKSRWPLGKVMVWAVIGWNFRYLVVLPSFVRTAEGEDAPFRLTAREYIRRCLSPFVSELVERRLLFQQDGAGCHTAAATRRYLTTKGVRVLESWPARSPDLNPIETLWALMSREVSLLCPRTQSDLCNAIRTAFDGIPLTTVNNLVASFPRRVRDVVRLNGSMLWRHFVNRRNAKNVRVL